AVGQHQFNGFAFYPNPASSIIKLENAIQIDSVEIYTMQGRKVFDISVKQLATSIDIQNLSAGTYFLKVASDGAVKTTKLIIQ
nr:T9SS type A sorting domain-containing protein [Flavobacterium sp.]